MFNRKDPLIDSVKNVMKENELRRDAERKLCEELGIASRKQLPREHLANYDALLEQKIAEALHPNQQKLDVHEPEKDKLTAQDFKMLRSMGKKKEMKEEQIDEVSKNKLLQYTDTALADMSQSDFGRGKYGDKTGERAKHGDKRQKGIYRAIKKLSGKAKVNATNEETITQDAKNPIPKTAAERIKGDAETAPKFVDKPSDQSKLTDADKAAMTNKVKEVMKEENIEEKAPPGAKFERMVKHIKKKYAKDGLTKQEKSIAYATAWKAKNKEEMKEAVEAELKKNLGEEKWKAMKEDIAGGGAAYPGQNKNEPDTSVKSAQSTANDVMGGDKPSTPSQTKPSTPDMSMKFAVTGRENVPGPNDGSSTKAPAPNVDIKAAQNTAKDVMGGDKPSAPAPKPVSPAPAAKPAAKPAAPATPAPKAAAPAPKPAAPAPKPAAQAPVGGPGAGEGEDASSPLAAMRQYNASKEAGAFDNKPATPAARPAARPATRTAAPMPPRRPASLRESLESTIKKIIEE